ncbi:U-box domain-containing protein 26-like [Miscanthus floridulus]|uniref:U-box domain-containing protein 26-like n=1 Tax=Miscanthus floridulus TaxID=154761 RepID=UPI003457B6E1
MALLVRKARRSLGGGSSSSVELMILVHYHYRCPISLDLTQELVIAPMGITYDRESIEAWLDIGCATCPVTHAPLRHEDLVPNHAIRSIIQDWCVTNRSRDVERIPTPKIPVTPVQASKLLFDLAGFTRHRDTMS